MAHRQLNDHLGEPGLAVFDAERSSNGLQDALGADEPQTDTLLLVQLESFV